MSRDAWTVAGAKAKFSELIEKAKSEGPQKITKHGRTAVVIVATTEEWDRLRKVEPIPKNNNRTKNNTNINNKTEAVYSSIAGHVSLPSRFWPSNPCSTHRCCPWPFATPFNSNAPSMELRSTTLFRGAAGRFMSGFRNKCISLIHPQPIVLTSVRFPPKEILSSRF
jgi:prevent-host-death family protein